MRSIVIVKHVKSLSIIKELSIMNPTFENKCIGLFVDLINQYHSISLAFNGSKLNYHSYLNKLKEEGLIYRAIAYGAYVDNEASDFINCLRSDGYEAKYVPAKLYNGRPIVKFTDRTIDIVLDIMRMIDKLDIVIIGSNNTNLIPLFSFLKEKGIRVIVFSCDIPREMKLHCDEWLEITEDLLENNRVNETIRNVEDKVNNTKENSVKENEITVTTQ